MNCWSYVNSLVQSQWNMMSTYWSWLCNAWIGFCHGKHLLITSRGLCVIIVLFFFILNFVTHCSLMFMFSCHWHPSSRNLENIQREINPAFGKLYIATTKNNDQYITFKSVQPFLWSSASKLQMVEGFSQALPGFIPLRRGHGCHQSVNI